MRPEDDTGEQDARPRQETTYGHRDPGADARHPGAGQSRSDDQPSGHGDEVDGRLVGGGVGHHLEIKSGEEENGEGPEVGGEGDEVGSGERWSPEERGRSALIDARRENRLTQGQRAFRLAPNGVEKRLGQDGYFAPTGIYSLLVESPWVRIRYTFSGGAMPRQDRRTQRAG